jgi:hypothetical protein
MNSWTDYVKKNYHLVSHLPNKERLAALSKMRGSTAQPREVPKAVSKKSRTSRTKKGGVLPTLTGPDLTNLPSDPNRPQDYKLDDVSNIDFNDAINPEAQLKKLGVQDTRAILKFAGRTDMSDDDIRQSDIGLLKNAYQRASQRINNARSDAEKEQIRQNAYDKAKSLFEANPYAAGEAEMRDSTLPDGSIDPAIDGYNRALAAAQKSLPTTVDNRTRIGISNVNTNTNTNTLSAGRLPRKRKTRKTKGGDIRINNENANTNTNSLSSGGDGGGGGDGLLDFLF